MKSLRAVVLAGIAGTLVAVQASAGDASAIPPNQPQRTDKAPEEQILGYWAPNWEAMAEKWKPLLKELAQLSLGDRSEEGLAKAEKEAAEEMKEGCRVMTMEFTKDKYIQHTGAGRVEAQGYVVKKIDAKTGAIEVELTSSHGGTPERGKLILAGNRLTFTGETEENSTPWILDRIDKAEFEKRQAAAAESKLFKDTGKTSKQPEPPKTREPKKPASRK